MRNPTVYHTLRAIAGGYLTYLGIEILRDGVLSGAMTGRSRLFGWIASIAFIVIGVLFVIHCLRSLFRIRQEETDAQAEGEEAKAEEAAPAVPSPSPVEPAGKSLFQRASVAVDASENEEDEKTGEDVFEEEVTGEAAPEEEAPEL